MRKLSLTDGKLSVEILPDCGGALSALRWTAHDGQTFDLLRPARAEDIAAQDARLLPCIPIGPFAHTGDLDAPRQPDLAEWTVQDASNIRATLTRHKEVGENENLHSSYQLLQRFELVPEGLRLQLTVTNIGIKPMSAQIGLRLRPDWRGENILCEAPAPARTAGELTQGYRLGQHDVHVCLRHQGHEIRYEWPKERLALVLSLVRGFEHMALDYWAGRREVWLTPLSHHMQDNIGVPDISMLQQGDSLSTAVRLSAAMLAASAGMQSKPDRPATPEA